MIHGGGVMLVEEHRASISRIVVWGTACAWVLLASTVAAESPSMDGAGTAEFAADSLLPIVLPDTAVADSTRLTIPIVIDLTAHGGSLGSYQGRLDFNPPILGYVDVTAGSFTGTVELNTDSAALGVVKFAGVNPDTLLNRGEVTILSVTLDVRGRGGAKGILGLSVSEVVTAGDFRDLSSRIEVRGGTILVDPGPITLTMRPDSVDVSSGETVALDLWVDLTSTVSEPGAIAGTLTLDPAALRVDSIRPGTFGGVAEANLDIQVDSGFVRWAVASGSPPAADSLVVATYFVRAIEGQGTVVELSLAVDELVNGQNLASLLPFLGPLPTTRIVVGQALQGIWGDANFTWRDFPEQPPVSAFDALICLSDVVGRDVSQFDAPACDVAPDAGSEYNGTVTALDALVILTSVVGRDTSRFRVGQSR